MEKNDDRKRVSRKFAAEAVILADGDYPTHAVPRNVLNEAQMVACCDGAVDAFVARGGVPHLIVGDGDSISEENRERFASIMVKVSEQETNDLTKTVTQLLQRGVKRIAIVGATGKREDHTLGNISLLLEYKRMGADVRMYTDYGVFVAVEGDTEFESFARQQVSVFNFGAKGLSAEGLEYPLSDFTSWWQGSLNQSSGDEFVIHAQGEYITFLTHEAK